MGSRFHHLVVDAHDPQALARFWAAVLGHRILSEAEDEVVVGSDEHDHPGLCFVLVPDEKTTKNRLHIDLNPDDQVAEVERIVALGARPVDVGQGTDKSWIVLADPEGNEFCVLRPQRSLVD
jgi:predicted enzyme related to lactoylglutathione lyase